jgi:hypothetical protein
MSRRARRGLRVQRNDKAEITETPSAPAAITSTALLALMPVRRSNPACADGARRQLLQASWPMGTYWR